MSKDSAELTFDAFVSYAQRPDAPIAITVRRMLERTAKPLWRRRALRVFVDQGAITAGASTAKALESAIDRSDHLVVLASPEAAESEWVEREIGHFIEQHDIERILIVLTGGSLEWNTSQQAFDEGATACPAVLREAFVEEPLWVDLRWADHEIDGPAERDRARSDLASIAAAIRRVDKDQLIGEHLTRQRRAFAVGATVACIVAALSVIAFFFALRSAESARAERSEAAGGRAAAQATERADSALLLAAASHAIDDTEGSERALVTTLAEASGVKRFHHLAEVGVRSLGYSPALQILVTGNEIGDIHLWDAATLKRVGSVESGGAGQVRDIVLDQTGRIAFAPSSDGSIVVIDLETGHHHAVPVSANPLRAIDVARSGTSVFVGDSAGLVFMVDIPSETVTRVAVDFDRVNAISIAPDQTTVAIAGRRNLERTIEPVVVLDLQHHSIVGTARDPRDTSVSVSGCKRACYSSVFTVDHLRSGELVFGTQGGTFVRWHASDQDPTAVVSIDAQISRVRAHDTSDEVIVAGFDSSVRLLRLGQGLEIGEPRLHHGATVWDAVFVDDSTLITASGTGSIAVEATNSIHPIGTVLFDSNSTPSSAGQSTDDLWDVHFLDPELTTAAIADGNDILVIDLEAGDELERVRVEGDRLAALSRGSGPSAVVSAQRNGTLRGWDTSWAVTKESWLPLSINALATHPTEEVLAVAGGLPEQDANGDGLGLVLFVSSTTLERIDDVEPITGLDADSLLDISFSANGETLYVGGTSPRYAAVDWRNENAPRRQNTTNGDVTSIATGATGSVVFGTQSQQVILSNGTVPLQAGSGAITATDLSTNELSLATGGTDRMVRIWDLGSRRALALPPLVGHSASIHTVAFDASGSRLLTASNAELIVWNLEPDLWVRIACDMANRPLSEVEWRDAVGGDFPTSLCTS